MKKNKLIYSIFVTVFFIAAGFIIIKFRSDENKKKAFVYELLNRNGLLAQSPEWPATKENAKRLLAAVKANPADIKSKVALANLFILEARTTGNYPYYDKAAMDFVNDILAQKPDNFEALTLQSLLYISQHHFADGLAIAEKAEKLNPYNAFLYGILVDGHVEMGNYDSAVASAERMMAIRPDLRSYSRASYLREIYGDYPGAIEAMQLAVDAGMPGDEATEWCRVQLGYLYEKSGDLKNAEISYLTALNDRPGFVYALAGMARLAESAKDYNKAIAYYQQADSLVDNASFKEELAQIYQLTGQKEKATATFNIEVNELNKNATDVQKDESIGHYADKELAYAFLNINNYSKALEHALAEYNRRPKNIEVNETLAWVYYQKGDYASAMPFIKVALSTNSKSPVLLCRAGLIYKKAGENTVAKKYLEDALKASAVLPASLKQSGEQTLKEI